jgi:hypothetical protein
VFAFWVPTIRKITLNDCTVKKCRTAQSTGWQKSKLLFQDLELCEFRYPNNSIQGKDAFEREDVELRHRAPEDQVPLEQFHVRGLIRFFDETWIHRRSRPARDNDPSVQVGNGNHINYCTPQFREAMRLLGFVESEGSFVYNAGGRAIWINPIVKS